MAGSSCWDFTLIKNLTASFCAKKTGCGQQKRLEHGSILWPQNFPLPGGPKDGRRNFINKTELLARGAGCREIKDARGTCV